ncbi:MAG: Mov34/MPN/PAD-1 family protein [Patulibacter sp.]|nr:Mov34/MPN/PAD-1 family protein [Patulibacter sp.]
MVLRPEAESTIRRLALESADGNETGGILLGADPGPDGVITVVHAGGAGPNAIRRPDFFSRDLDHTRRFAARMFQADRSTWVGEWHTHPHGVGEPSPTDMATYSSILHETPALAVFVAVIVTPGDGNSGGADTHDRWTVVRLHTWVIYRPESH